MKPRKYNSRNSSRENKDKVLGMRDIFKKMNKNNQSYTLEEFAIDIFRVIFSVFKTSFNNLRDEIKSDSKKPIRLDGLEKTRKHRPDFLIILFMALIMMTGLITMYVLSPHRANFLNTSYGTDNYTEMFFFQRQALFLVIGIICFIFTSSVPIVWFYRHAWKFLILSFALCIILAISSVLHLPLAKCELGACRWFQVGPISIQISEFLKAGVLIALSVFLGARVKEGKVNNTKETLIPAGLLIGAMIVVIAGFQKDLGTAISALSIVIFQFFIAGLSWKNIRIAGIVLAIVMVGAIIIAPHRMSRIATFFSSENCSNLSSAEAKDDYHICHSKIAIGSGGLFGVGLGNSVQATGYLPEIINDSIFAALGEMFGLVGLMAVLAVFFALIMRILRVASYMKNPTSRILVAGVGGWFVFHTLMNISAMIGLMPLTGITMPLISFGGTSIVILSAVLGLVFNISAYTSFRQIKDFKEGQDEDSRSRRRIGRTRYASRRGI